MQGRTLSGMRQSWAQISQRGHHSWEHLASLNFESEGHSVMSNPMDYTVHGILQARILEWVAFSFSRGSSQPRNRNEVSHIAGRFFTS